MNNMIERIMEEINYAELSRAEQLEYLRLAEFIKSKISLKPIPHISSTINWANSYPEIKGRKVSDVYLDYLIYCENNNFIPVKKIILGKFIKDRFGLSSKPITEKGKSLRIFS